MHIEIDLFKDCNECPCRSLLTEERKKIINLWNNYFYKNLYGIKEVKLILLGESMPASRYFYDKQSSYNEGFRYNLKKSLNIASDDELFSFLQKKGVIVMDCAFCPLHCLSTNKARRHSATYCLQHHNKNLILKYPNVPIFSFFPSKLGYLKSEIPDIKITHQTNFSKINPIAEYIKNMK